MLIDGILIFHIAHGFAVAALMSAIAAVEKRNGTSTIGDIGGIAQQAPILATTTIMALMVAVAVPGTVGFIGEFLLLQVIFQYSGVIVAAWPG